MYRMFKSHLVVFDNPLRGCRLRVDLKFSFILSKKLIEMYECVCTRGASVNQLLDQQSLNLHSDYFIGTTALHVAHTDFST